MSGHILDRELMGELIRDLTPASGDTVSVLAPFTGLPLYQLPQNSPAEVRQVTDRVRLAQLAWARSGFAHRREVLLRAHDLVVERSEQLLDIVQSETGKTRGQAFEEVFQSAAVTRYNALTARKALRGRAHRGGIPLVVRTHVRYAPKGVIGVITPWNYPLSLTAMDVVPALAAGCGVLQKADNQGALSTLALRAAFIEAGVPSDLWAVVAGDGGEVGDAVTSTADYICFTGSTATGKKVAATAAERLIGASLELGGKNPLIVLDDVDPSQAAADAAYACFSALGQLCVSIERIYVQQGVADDFISAFVARTQALVQNAGFDFAADVGSLASAAQLERVNQHLDDARAKGATVLAGGNARPDLGPYFFEPTILSGVSPDMECYANETFGAIVAVSVVDTDQEAILAANDSEFGLNASIFSGNPARAERLAHGIEAGSVNINEGYRASFSSIDAPMGGVKQSGLGRRNGIEGLRRFTEPITISRATGLLQLPRTGREAEALAGPMTLLLGILRLIRRR